MRPTPTRRIPALTAPILLPAQAVLATTERAWQVQPDPATARPPQPVGPATRLRGLEVPAARLVSRIYRYANAPLRAEMLACLLRPLGALSLVGVAAGAFAPLLQRDGVAPGTIPLEMVARYTSEQVIELVLFVHEVSPDVLAQLSTLLADGAIGAAALSASAFVLLYRRLRSTQAAETSAANASR